MIDMSTARSMGSLTVALDRKTRGECPNAFGVSCNSTGAIIHLDDIADAGEQDAAQDILDYADTLTINASMLTIDADGVDESVITCAEHPMIFNFWIYCNGILDSYGAVADGSLEFSAITTGEYLVEIEAPSGFATGFITITGEVV